jgi:HEPN domain-containing protein
LDWVRKAEIDRETAQLTLAATRRSPQQAESACFHAQQCAEKYLKALLTLNAQAVPRTHDLQELALLLRRYHFPALKLRSALQDLNIYSVAIRYPGLCATAAQARRAVRAMESVVKVCRPFLGDKKKP